MENININIIEDELGILAKYWDEFTVTFWDYLPKIVLAALVAFIGFFIIKYVEKALAAFFKKANFDEVLERFVQSFLVIVAKITLLGVVISILGVEASSFVAVFGAMVFAVGMALQGSLSNFAGGVLILIFKPFKLGDFIKTEGESGTVIDMQIFNTILKRSDGVKVILPNGAVSNGTIINSTDIEEKRIDFIIGIGYGDSIKKAREVLEKVAAKDDRILKEKGVHVSVNNLGDNSVDILFRVWTKREDNWDVKCDMLEVIKNDFDKAGVSFPFPQRDVHMHNEK